MFNKENNEKKLNNKGFSLVELIIVMAIMAILVGVVGTQVIPYMNQASESKDLQIVSSFGTAAMTAYANNAEDAPTSGSVTIEVFGGTYTAGTFQAEVQADIQELTYTAIGDVTDAMSSADGQTTDEIQIIIDIDNRTITAQAMASGAAVLEPVESPM